MHAWLCITCMPYTHRGQRERESWLLWNWSYNCELPCGSSARAVITAEPISPTQHRVLHFHIVLHFQLIIFYWGPGELVLEKVRVLLVGVSCICHVDSNLGCQAWQKVPFLSHFSSPEVCNSKLGDGVMILARYCQVIVNAVML